MPLLWEFPGGRVEEGESDEEALKFARKMKWDAKLEQLDAKASKKGKRKTAKKTSLPAKKKAKMSGTKKTAKKASKKAR